MEERRMKPLAVDLCAGLGGWTDGLLAEGWDAVGFDIERHQYGNAKYPAQLVLQDIRTLDGRQFRGKVSLIVASPPYQEFSYMAMPWSRAKKIAAEYRSGVRDVKKLTELFDACVRIGREAECPIVIENVRGAQPWVGRSRWNFGSFHLFGDVPALMPMTRKHIKVDGFRFDGSGKSFQSASVEHTKNSGGSWFAIAHNTTSGHSNNARDQRVADGVKNGKDWFGAGEDCSQQRKHGSKSNARKAASAAIAKIPFALASYIARTFKPMEP